MSRGNALSKLKTVPGDEMPVIKDLDMERWYAGLPDISRHLQERHPESPIGVIGTAARPGTGQATQAQDSSFLCMIYPTYVLACWLASGHLAGVLERCDH